MTEVDLTERIAILEQECRDLAGWLMSPWVNVNESKVAEVDLVLSRYLGDINE